MGSFFLWFGLCFGFLRRVHVLPVHVRKRGDRLKPATAALFFLIASGAWLVVRARNKKPPRGEAWRLIG
jgi:hypothetical protein